MVVASTEVRYVARVSEDEAAHLRELHTSNARVHKSLPDQHPRRQQSRDLSETLTRLHRRGVPIDVLADILQISHQAVRARVNATELPSAELDLKSATTVETVDTLSRKSWASDLVLVSDSGMHRRLLVYTDPSSIGHLRMLKDVPALMKSKQAITWLESVSEVVTGSAPSSTPLRTPPAVFIARAVAEEVLTELTPASDVR